MGNMDIGHGTHSTKMGADKLAWNTPNAPKFICPNCLPSPKVWDFDEKMLHWVSVVRRYSCPMFFKSLIWNIHRIDRSSHVFSTFVVIGNKSTCSFRILTHMNSTQGFFSSNIILCEVVSVWESDEILKCPNTANSALWWKLKADFQWCFMMPFIQKEVDSIALKLIKYTRKIQNPRVEGN